jgi:hypothetical protein
MATGDMLLMHISWDPNINPQDQAIDFKVPLEFVNVINVNAGVEWYINPRIILRAGFFTDFYRGTDFPRGSQRSQQDFGSYKMDKFGGTLGLAYAGDMSQFQISFLAVVGMGDVIGEATDADFSVVYPRTEITNTTFMLAFSGRIEASVIYAAVRRAFDEEVGRALNPPASAVEAPPESTGETPPEERK